VVRRDRRCIEIKEFDCSRDEFEQRTVSTFGSRQNATENDEQFQSHDENEIIGEQFTLRFSGQDEKWG
jgi:hypothetical protein